MHIPPEFFELPADAVHVLCVNVSEHRNALEASVGALDPAERERAAHYANPWHGQRYACTRGMLRLVLGRFLKRAPGDIEFSYGACGKPALNGAGGLNFNLSHNGDWVALGVTRGRRIGIDLDGQTDGHACLAVASQCFSPREMAKLVQGTDTAHVFCAIWVRKEAVLKAAGRGLDAMQTFCTNNPVVSLPDEWGLPAQWHVSDVPVPPGQHMALAVEAGPVRNRCFRF